MNSSINSNTSDSPTAEQVAAGVPREARRLAHTETLRAGDYGIRACGNVRNFGDGIADHYIGKTVHEWGNRCFRVTIAPPGFPPAPSGWEYAPPGPILKGDHHIDAKGYHDETCGWEHDVSVEDYNAEGDRRIIRPSPPAPSVAPDAGKAQGEAAPQPPTAGPVVFTEKLGPLCPACGEVCMYAVWRDPATVFWRCASCSLTTRSYMSAREALADAPRLHARAEAANAGNPTTATAEALEQRDAAIRERDEARRIVREVLDQRDAANALLKSMTTDRENWRRWHGEILAQRDFARSMVETTSNANATLARDLAAVHAALESAGGVTTLERARGAMRAYQLVHDERDQLKGDYRTAQEKLANVTEAVGRAGVGGITLGHAVDHLAAQRDRLQGVVEKMTADGERDG